MEFKSDYYYGNESEQYVFYRIPKVLFTEPCFKKMSNDARVLYGLMLDRMGLSIKNNWHDEDNRIYIYFTLEDVQEYMSCGHTKGVKIIAELEKLNLIERVKQGQGKPTKIYIKKFFTDEGHSYPQKNKSYPQSYPQGSLDFSKQEVQTSANEKSRLPQNGSADFSKADTNNTKYNNNDFNNNDFNKSMSKSVSCHINENKFNNDYDNDYDIDCSDNSEYPLNSFINTDKKQKQIENYVKEQINYKSLSSSSLVGKEEVDSLIFIITEIMLSNSPTIRIGSEDKPLSVVQSVISKVDYGIIIYTINKFKEQKHPIKHKKTYLLTCLYNARTEGIYNGINYLNCMGYSLPQSG